MADIAPFQVMEAILGASGLSCHFHPYAAGFLASRKNLPNGRMITPGGLRFQSFPHVFVNLRAKVRISRGATSL